MACGNQYILRACSRGLPIIACYALKSAVAPDCGAVLSATSPVFKSMLSGERLEALQLYMVIPVLHLGRICKGFARFVNCLRRKLRITC